MNLSEKSVLTIAALLALSWQTASAAAVTPPADLVDWICTGHCGSLAPEGDVTSSPLGSPKHGYVSTSNSAAIGVSPISAGGNKVGEETNGSRIVSGPFNANASDTLTVQFNYVSTDGNGYDDYAWARVLDADDDSLVAWIFSARSTNSGSRQIVPGDILDNDEFDPDEIVVNNDAYEFTSKTANWSPLGDSNNICWQEDAKGCGFTGWLESRFTFSRSGSFKVEVGVTNWGDTAYDSALAFDFQNITDSGISAPIPEPAPVSLFVAGLFLLGLTVRRSV